VVKDLPIFDKVCIQFHFKKGKPGIYDTIIFSKIDCIFEMNFETSATKVIYKFQVPLTRQPEFFSLNDEQTIFVTASSTDGIHYNSISKKETDLDELYNISNIKEMIYENVDKQFYLLANSYQEKIGLFLIRFDLNDPNIFKFILKWKNKLDIADANLFIIKMKGSNYRELIISYKTIYINTYNVKVVDISTKEATLFRHESFQLWESECMGFLLNRKKDFITLSKSGL
jgi:hypothetical protein